MFGKKKEQARQARVEALLQTPKWEGYQEGKAYAIEHKDADSIQVKAEIEKNCLRQNYNEADARIYLCEFVKGFEWMKASLKGRRVIRLK